MGAAFSEPVVEKHTTSCESKIVSVGSSAMQGWRITMEDAHTHILSLPGDENGCFFGVYDGHGGQRIANYCQQHLHNRITLSKAFQTGEVPLAITAGFLSLDAEMHSLPEFAEEYSGSTANIAIITGNKLYVGNCGDSRTVASVGGVAKQLSSDHKPTCEIEQKRILAAGGWIEFNRVNGNLALTRAMGDFTFKQNNRKPAEEQIITALPDVITVDLTAEDYEFLVLACDGVWDVLSNQEVVDLVRHRMARHCQPSQICEELMMRCLAMDCNSGGVGCDNMTVIIVALTNHGTYADLCSRCSRPTVSTVSNAGRHFESQNRWPSPATWSN